MPPKKGGQKKKVVETTSKKVASARSEADTVCGVCEQVIILDGKEQAVDPSLLRWDSVFVHGFFRLVRRSVSMLFM